MKLLLVEDDDKFAASFKLSLQKSFSIDLAICAEEGLFYATNSTYDLILIDIALPDMNGLQLCRQIRNQNAIIPIIILTGMMDVESKTDAFAHGCDDYLTKPFEKKELIARMYALLRRCDNRKSINNIKIGDLCIDLDHQIIIRRRKKLHLRRKEFLILTYLARNAGKVISRDKLQSYIWGDDIELSANTIDVHINYLRDIIDKPFDTHLITTIHGVGYSIKATINKS